MTHLKPKERGAQRTDAWGRKVPTSKLFVSSLFGLGSIEMVAMLLGSECGLGCMANFRSTNGRQSSRKGPVKCEDQYVLEFTSEVIGELSNRFTRKRYGQR